MCLGANIRKVFSAYNNENKIEDKYWHVDKNIKKEIFPFPKQKRTVRN